LNGEIFRINNINNYSKVNAIVVYVLNKRGGYCEKEIECINNHKNCNGYSGNRVNHTCFIKQS
jgi:hypothetical protein